MAEWDELVLNPFFLASQFAFWVNLLLFILLSRRSRVMTGSVSSLLILCFVLWALGDSMMRASTDVRMASFWNNLSGIGWCFAPSLFLLSSAVLTRKGWRAVGLLYVPSLAFLLLLWFSPHINSGVTLTKWGYSALLGPWLWTYLVYAVLFFLIGIFLLLGARRGILKVLGFISALMLLLGGVTDLLLPHLGLNVEIFPVFAVPISFFLFVACWMYERRGWATF